LKDGIELTVEVYFVSDKLEPIVNCCKVSLLHHEFFDVVHWYLQLLDAFKQPLFHSISAFLSHLGNKLFNPVVELLRAWQKSLFNGFRVQLQ